MDTGGRPLSGTFNAGSDDCPIASFCSPCELRNNSKIEAKHFCTQCEESLCTTCLNFHGSFQQTRDHTVLDGPFEECFQHAGNPITMFCNKHDSLACPVCITRDHRKCDVQMCYLPDVTIGVRKSKEYFDVGTKIECIGRAICDITHSRQETKISLTASSVTSLEVIKEFRKRVNKIFDDLETEAISYTNKKHDSDTTLADDDIQVCNHLLAEMQQLKQRIQTPNPNNEQHIFIEMKKGQKLLADIDQIVSYMYKRRITPKHECIINPKIEKYLLSIKRLENFDILSNVNKLFGNLFSPDSYWKILKGIKNTTSN